MFECQKQYSNTCLIFANDRLQPYRELLCIPQRKSASNNSASVLYSTSSLESELAQRRRDFNRNYGIATSPTKNKKKIKTLTPLINQVGYSERELTFSFAICCRPSVCRLS